MSGSVAGLETYCRRKTNNEEQDRRPASHTATSIGKNGSDQIATLIINGIISRTRLEMLQGFLRQSDIDILFLQVVTHPNLDVLRGYKTHYIVGTRV